MLAEEQARNASRLCDEINGSPLTELACACKLKLRVTKGIFLRRGCRVCQRSSTLTNSCKWNKLFFWGVNWPDFLLYWELSSLHPKFVGVHPAIMFVRPGSYTLAIPDCFRCRSFTKLDQSYYLGTLGLSMRKSWRSLCGRLDPNMQTWELGVAIIYYFQSSVVFRHLTAIVWHFSVLEWN